MTSNIFYWFLTFFIHHSELFSSVSEAVSRAELCCEAVIPLFSMVRATLHVR